MKRIAITCLALCLTLSACDRKQKESAVQQDTYVKFTSHLGNSFVAPSQWTTTDKGDTFSLKSPDGKAIIHAIMFTAEGSGPLNEFRETMASGLLPKEATGWKASNWTTIKLGEVDAGKRELIPVPESHQQWRLYVMDGGKFYHAIVLNASADAMTLNGGFYENIVRTFNGVRQ
jgi:hypothetical protein